MAEQTCDWRTIDSAPAIECNILAWDGFSVFECYWYGHRRVGETAGSHSIRPWISHWMPLPSPPHTPQEDGK